ncbi:Pro-neuregulin-3, membrane-bound isoform [Liparis tanakae]|uniref:Pro-neuregulin-3, membrane-bound isoform n=1 Tax=Liparis tanakae TaxID=230148 RepID=A0A4Z2IQE6_9TELE|nr:Pro-neuregulin-3, membrane-bound isoform [Liparis tanakae]
MCSVWLKMDVKNASKCKEGYHGLRCDQFVPKTDALLSDPSGRSIERPDRPHGVYQHLSCGQPADWLRKHNVLPDRKGGVRLVAPPPWEAQHVTHAFTSPTRRRPDPRRPHHPPSEDWVSMP